jgi:thiol:disulfide interchange protein DsbC
MPRMPSLFALVFTGLALAACTGKTSVDSATADKKGPAVEAHKAAPADVEATLRKVLAERVPELPKIDEITTSQVPGLYEVRYGGAEIIYVDASGQFLIQGALIDTKTMANLTERRIDKFTAVNFSTLPLKDAVVIKQGDGSRKMAVFVDPNCGYCKRFERDLMAINNVTLYTFLMPILGPDSKLKSRDIWCAADASKAWRAWMVENVPPPKAAESCDVALLDRNVEFGRKHRINGTPALLFEDGTRKAGALPGKMVDELLTAATKKS